MTRDLVHASISLLLITNLCLIAAINYNQSEESTFKSSVNEKKFNTGSCNSYHKSPYAKYLQASIEIKVDTVDKLITNISKRVVEPLENSRSNSIPTECAIVFETDAQPKPLYLIPDKLNSLSKNEIEPEIIKSQSGSSNCLDYSVTKTVSLYYNWDFSADTFDKQFTDYLNCTNSANYLNVIPFHTSSPHISSNLNSSSNHQYKSTETFNSYDAKTQSENIVLLKKFLEIFNSLLYNPAYLVTTLETLKKSMHFSLKSFSAIFYPLLPHILALPCHTEIIQYICTLSEDFLLSHLNLSHASLTLNSKIDEPIIIFARYLTSNTKLLISTQLKRYANEVLLVCNAKSHKLSEFLHDYQIFVRDFKGHSGLALVTLLELKKVLLLGKVFYNSSNQLESFKEIKNDKKHIKLPIFSFEIFWYFIMQQYELAISLKRYHIFLKIQSEQIERVIGMLSFPIHCSLLEAICECQPERQILRFVLGCKISNIPHDFLIKIRSWFSSEYSIAKIICSKMSVIEKSQFEVLISGIFSENLHALIQYELAQYRTDLKITSRIGVAVIAVALERLIEARGSPIEVVSEIGEDCCDIATDWLVLFYSSIWIEKDATVLNALCRNSELSECLKIFLMKYKKSYGLNLINIS